MRKLLFIVGGVVGCIVLMMAINAWIDPIEARKDWTVQEEKKQKLLATQSTKEEAIQILGHCTDFSRGGTNEMALKRSFDQDPKNWPEVREKVAQYPGVLFTTTANVQTWVFLDQSNRVVEVILLPQ